MSINNGILFVPPNPPLRAVHSILSEKENVHMIQASWLAWKLAQLSQSNQIVTKLTTRLESQNQRSPMVYRLLRHLWSLV